MTPFRNDPTTIAEHVEAVAQMTRKPDLSEADYAILTNALRNLIGPEPILKQASVEDALAMVVLAREFMLVVCRGARELSPEMTVNNPLAFFSGRMDLAMAQAVNVLENVAGKSSAPYAWGKGVSLQ